MYEYMKTGAKMGQIQDGIANIFGSGIGVSPARPGVIAPHITPENVGIFGAGVAVSPAIPSSHVPHIHSANVNVFGIDQCANGCYAQVPAPLVDLANTYGVGTGPDNGQNSRPMWQYALLGIGLGAGVYMLARRSRMMRNPESELSPAEITKQAAAISIQAGIPTILWGPPGIGKTQWVKGLGNAMAPMNDGKPVKVFTLIGSTKDPTDIGGMPTVKGGRRPPSWAADIRKRSLNGQRSILFLDEFSSMSPMVHASLLRVVNEKMAAETDFDPRSAPLKGRAVHIVAAANRPKHGAASRDLPPPAANRMIHFNWPSPNAIEWAEGMLFGWKSPFYFELPEDWRSGPFLRDAREMTGAFLKFRESKASPVLFAMPEMKAVDDEGNRATGGAWPSPRSWEMAADVLAATMVAGAPKNVQIQAVEGAVGAAVAGELFNFAKFQDLPDPEDILKHPEGWKVPTDATKLFIVSNALVNALRIKITEDRYDAAWRAMVHAIKANDDVPTLTVAARELAAMKADLRYRDVLEAYKPPSFAGKKFAPAFRKMKLM